MICPVDDCLGYDERKATLTLHLYEHIVTLSNKLERFTKFIQGHPHATTDMLEYAFNIKIKE